MSLEVSYAKQAANYLKRLDNPTRKRIKDKVAAVAADYLDPTNSYPLGGSEKRSARVGGYRILLLIIKEKNALVVANIDSRGQVYRNA